MGKKTKLIAEITYDFHLLGIVSPIKEHQLAWNLNRSGLFCLEKRKDIVIKFKDLSMMVISNFVCESEMHHHTLLRNRLVAGNVKTGQLLLPELQQFDFFLKLMTDVDEFDLDPLISSLKQIPVIDYLVKLDIEKIKQKENLLY